MKLTLWFLAFLYKLIPMRFSMQAVAAATGVVLDPVYSGKALHGLMRDIAAAGEEWAGRKLLFVHTGGLLVRERVGAGTGLPNSLWHAEEVQAIL
jgi:hypothetical protein